MKRIATLLINPLRYTQHELTPGGNPLKSLTISRNIYFAISALAAGSVVIAVVMQMLEDLTPCPLCILQRVFLITLAVASALRGAQKRASRWLSVPTVTLSIAAALACAGIAGQHYYEQTHPLEFSSCAPGFEAWWNQLALVKAVPVLLQATGQCMLVDVTVLGLPMPVCSFAVATVCLVATLFAACRTGRQRP